MMANHAFPSHFEGTMSKLKQEEEFHWHGKALDLFSSLIFNDHSWKYDKNT